MAMTAFERRCIRGYALLDCWWILNWMLEKEALWCNRLMCMYCYVGCNMFDAIYTITQVFASETL